MGCQVCQGVSGGAREFTGPQCLQRVDDVLVPLQLMRGVLTLVQRALLLDPGVVHRLGGGHAVAGVLLHQLAWW